MIKTIPGYYLISCADFFIGTKVHNVFKDLLMPEPILYSEQELLTQIVQGNEKAFNSFYHQTSGGLYNAIMSYLKDSETAREIMQVAYIRIWTHRESLTQISSLKNYLFIIARNATFDHFRKLISKRKLISGIKERTPEIVNHIDDHIDRKELDTLFHEVISHLPTQQRQAYLLAIEDQLSYDEIAAKMNVSKFTVKRHLDLARKFVRKYISQHHQQEMQLPLFSLLLLFYSL